jgi:NAD(P)-dependent dehydrogenase (short-subunit alcohol dehydrogenase family)
MTGGWDVGDIPDQRDRTVVVTGANSGLGRATAAALAQAGAHVVLAVRDTERGEKAAAGMAGSTEVRRLDLADLASVRAFAQAWEGSLDVLVNNAGVMAVPRGRTVDGFETQFGTNHPGSLRLDEPPASPRRAPGRHRVVRGAS